MHEFLPLNCWEMGIIYYSNGKPLNIHEIFILFHFNKTAIFFSRLKFIYPYVLFFLHVVALFPAREKGERERAKKML